jgi:hypothetical protein
LRRIAWIVVDDRSVRNESLQCPYCRPFQKLLAKLSLAADKFPSHWSRNVRFIASEFHHSQEPAAEPCSVADVSN